MLGCVNKGGERPRAAVVPVGPRHLRQTPYPLPFLAAHDNLWRTPYARPLSLAQEIARKGMGKMRGGEGGHDLDAGVRVRVELLHPTNSFGQIASPQRVAAGKEEVLASPRLLRVDAAEEGQRWCCHDLAQPRRYGR